MADVVDRIGTQKRVEKLTGEQRDDLFTQLLMGKDYVETIETSRGKFEVKYPRAADLIMIGKIAAFRRGGKSPEMFDVESETVIQMTSMLDVVVVSGPKWYEDAKAKNKNFSFEEVPSRVFIGELYGKAYSFRAEIEQRLNPPEGSAVKPVSTTPGNDGVVGGGAFTGLSSESGDTET